MATHSPYPPRPWFRWGSFFLVSIVSLYLGVKATHEAIEWLRAFENGTAGGDLVTVAAYGYGAVFCAIVAFFIGADHRDRPIQPQEWAEFTAYMARWRASRERRKKTMQDTLDDRPVSLTLRHTSLVRAAVFLAIIGAGLAAFAIAVRQGLIASPVLLFVGGIIGVAWALATMFLIMIKLDRMKAPDKDTS